MSPAGCCSKQITAQNYTPLCVVYVARSKIKIWRNGGKPKKENQYIS